MKFASFPKFALLLLPVGVFALALAGCGGSNNLNLTQGNWSVTATSTATARPGNIADNVFYVGGNLTQNKNTLSGLMHVANSGCIDPSQQIAITGTVKDKDVTLTTTAFQDQVITVTATGSDPSTLSGTYKITGGLCDGDQGTVSASATPSISGTWTGLVNPVGPPASHQGISQATISIALTQASTPSEDGSFALTGDITYTNSNCSVSGSITSGFVAGQFILINASTVEKDESTGSFSYYPVFLDSPSAPKNMTGDYNVGDGMCGGDFEHPTFTKQ